MAGFTYTTLKTAIKNYTETDDNILTTTIIDHGVGVYTGYWHQQESKVSVGQKLAYGELIGYVGNTGLSTGPHLHWEVWVNGIQVNPLEWIDQEIN